MDPVHRSHLIAIALFINVDVPSEPRALCQTLKSPLINTFFLPIGAPFILPQVTAIPAATTPSELIVTAAPTLTVVEVVTPVANTSPSGLNVTPPPTLIVLEVVTPVTNTSPSGLNVTPDPTFADSVAVKDVTIPVVAF